MKQLSFTGLCIALSLCLLHHARAQDSLLQVPGKYLNDLEKKSDLASKRIKRSVNKALTAVLQQENKLFKKVNKINPGEAARIFRSSIDSLSVLKKALSLNKLQLPGKAAYVPYLDSLQITLAFFNQNKEGVQAGKQKLDGALSHVKSLQSSVNNATQVEAYIKAQKEALKAQLSSYTQLNKELEGLSKTAYYYSQQFNEYKSMLADKKKAEKKLLELLVKNKAYNNFLQKNLLAGLFNLPSASVDQQVEGLQTRTVVEETIRQKIGSSPQAKQAVSQAMDKAQQEFAKYKSKLPDLKSAGDMPEFKPRPMKGKALLRRLELGGNLQFKKTTQYLPSTAEIAAQVAYKLNDKSSAGIGLAYACGTGTGWEHIQFTHHSVGLRSFMDWKLKGSFYISGGIEGRYISTIRNLNELKAWNRWQPAALLGISKKYKVSPKLKGNVQLLYDFMAASSHPRHNPIVIRFGYTKSK